MPEGTPGEGTKDGEFFVASYKSQEEAEKGIAEKDKTISRLTNESKAATAKATQLETQVLAKLAAAAAQKAPAASDDDAEARQARSEQIVSDIADALKDDEEKGTRKLLQYMSAVTADAETAAGRKVREAVEASEKQVASQLEAIQETLRERDPDYVSNKERVEELAEAAGLDATEHRQALLAIVKAQNKTDHPDRHDLPGGAESARVIADDGGPALSPEVEALLANTIVGKITDAEKAALKKGRK